MKSVSEYIKENIDKTIIENKENDGSLLGLPKPYTVPCAEENGRFRELYYWDTYFTNIALIALGKIEQAKNNTDDILYLIDSYGFMPNGNRTWYLNRSQPPFSWLMVNDVFKNTGDKGWLENSFKILKKEYSFWQTRRLGANGLNIYRGNNDLSSWEISELSKDFENRTGTKDICNRTDDERLKIAQTVMTFVESGWDCCSRFGTDGYSVNPIDLNSLLYGFELKMSEFSVALSNGEEKKWSSLAELRKQKMDKYMLDRATGIYMDYNFSTGKISRILSAASLYPMFVGLSDDRECTAKIINSLFLKYGVSASNNRDKNAHFQWDYPNIWPPLQYISYIACKNTGCDDLADEIAARYIHLIDINFEKTGNLWEKYDGNTGAVSNYEYNSPPMMGWTAGAYEYFKSDVRY